jgi:hypothetical protein
MSGLDNLAKLKKWMHRNKTGLISWPGNPGNRVTTHIYNIINNNNINIIDSEDPALEPVTSTPLDGVTGVTENGALKGSRLPGLPREKIPGDRGYPTISTCLPRLPRLPLCGGERDIEAEKVFAAHFLDWSGLEVAKWPEVTRAALSTIREWFQAKGYLDPADRILAFITMFELMRRRGGPITLDPELARLGRVAREIFGGETELYLSIIRPRRECKLLTY